MLLKMKLERDDDEDNEDESRAQNRCYPIGGMILVMDLSPHHHAVSVPSPVFSFSTTAALLSNTLQTNHSATQRDRQRRREIRPACVAARLPFLPSFLCCFRVCPSTILSVVLCPPSTGTRAQLSLRVRPLISLYPSLPPFFSLFSFCCLCAISFPMVALFKGGLLYWCISHEKKLLLCAVSGVGVLPNGISPSFTSASFWGTGALALECSGLK